MDEIRIDMRWLTELASKHILEQDVKAVASLMAKLNAVYADTGYVPQDGYNSYNKYNYALAGDVISMARESFAKHGLSIVTLGPAETSVIENSKGNLISFGVYTYMILDGESGASIIAASYGAGADTLDKFAGKENTNAYKYFLAQNAMISWGIDIEAETQDSSGNMVATTTKNQTPSAHKFIDDEAFRSAFKRSGHNGKWDKLTPAQRAEIENIKKNILNRIEEKYPNWQDKNPSNELERQELQDIWQWTSTLGSTKNKNTALNNL